jgi:hypothetical protein
VVRPIAHLPFCRRRWRFIFLDVLGYSNHDKLLLAFDALTLGEALGSAPPFGKIMHGAQNRIAKITVATLFPIVRSFINEILSQAETHHPPQLILNKHCADCEFNSRCRQTALEKGELSHSQRFRRCRKREAGESIINFVPTEQ